MGKQEVLTDSEPETRGISCYVRCTSNKIDTAKDNVRSINWNFDIRVGDKLIGKGNNLNVNNITPEDYKSLCAQFGVEDIDENTPFYADLMTLNTKEKKQAWDTAMERKDKKIDKDQSDVTRDPDILTEKQEALIADWMKEDGSLILKVTDFCKELNVTEWTKLNKKQATELITKLKEARDKPPAEKAEEPKPKKAKKKKE